MRLSLRSERGSALVVSMAVLGILLVVGIPVLDAIDRTQRRTTTERVRETAYNVAESAMGAQTRALTAVWPHNAARALPAQCIRTSTNPRCPQAAVMLQDFATSDFDAASTWTVEVRDNNGPAANYYNRAALNSVACPVAPCTWDANGDGVMWVRSQANIRGRDRTLVALVRQNIVGIPIPRAVITAGKLSTTNNGRKTIIDVKGCKAKHRPAGTCNSVQPAPVVVRCTTTTPATSGDPCLGYRSEQVSPNLYEMDPTEPNMLTPSQLETVRSYAIQAGTYRNACPLNNAEMTGKIVFIEPATSTSPTLNCTYGGPGAVNTAAAPGIFILNRGTLALNNNFEFYGVVYLVNNIASPGDEANILTMDGNSYIQGGIFVDGKGGVRTGDSGLNVSFDEAAYGLLQGVSGNASLVQNSYRELPRGQ